MHIVSELVPGLVIRIAGLMLLSNGALLAADKPAKEKTMQLLEYKVQLDVPYKEYSDNFGWYQARVTPIPAGGKNGAPAVIMTLQKLLGIWDFYSGLWTMRSDDGGQTWSGPAEVSELAWRYESSNIFMSVSDVTLGWHGPSGKILGLGAESRYDKRYQDARKNLADKPLSTAYTVFDPKAGRWSSWGSLEMPASHQATRGYCASCQWLVEPDGTILAPIYFSPLGNSAYQGAAANSVVMVLRCGFDGKTLKYLEHGDELTLAEDRGLAEPSLTCFQGKYYLTIRSDKRGYVAVGKDGLRYTPIKAWVYDDGTELGNYNTQQHWVTHSDGLFLVYTRRGANNDHVFRHRAPLFMAQVDPEKLCVLRATERVLIPERGAEMGNFGATTITAKESWVTVCEGMHSYGSQARQRGAEGAIFVARIVWGKPNRLADQNRQP